MPAADFIKEIQAKKLKAVQDRLRKEKASQKYTPDPKKPGVFHSLLHVAAETGDVPILDALLAAAADVSAVDQNDNTPLHWACRSDAGAKAAEALIKKKAKLDAANKAGLTPLAVAAAAGAGAVVDVLLKAGAKADYAPPGGPTPLHAAVAAACGPGTATAATAASSSSAAGASGAPAAPAAAAARSAGSAGAAGAATAAATGAAAAAPLKPSLMLAVVDKLVAAGAPLAGKDAAGRTPLMVLVGAGRVAEALQLLERKGVGLDELDGSGRSVLLAEVAAGGGDAGAGAGGSGGPGAAAAAAASPHMDLVRGLVDKGASADLADPTSKDTPLHMAARRGDGALVAALLPAVKKHYARNAAKLTAAEVALLEAPAAAAAAAAGAGSGSSGGAAIAEAIVAAGGEPGEAGLGLMKAAVEKKADGLAAKLVPLLKPAVLTSLDLDFTRLVAAGLGKAAMAYVARFEPEHAAGDCVVDEASGNTRLHAVAEAGACYDVVAALLSLGLSPNVVNREGDTPLHVAARGGHMEVCKALVAGGADVLRRNNKNRTPKTQLKLPEAVKEYLEVAEEEFRAAKEAKKSALWDDKMKATQTESAFGLRVM
ncbi:hypothetical protein HYH02_013725 [Chlamydomonas schloesseri]|uniref:Uncharacterized protein n=1 Tax=Chlamydomonas schloesseri TaxID=2026947 RepID=A0A835VYB4_9CHLO|nr:hypothetical protein HYH02_013725 [Chlamydomonas schloesseri]|eukprot:KAG2430363.1 hypothetical protein HYH02_013725 [Chlamydomonas schloesseri]